MLKSFSTVQKRRECVEFQHKGRKRDGGFPKKETPRLSFVGIVG
jgi:hypothetical protein